MNLGRWLCALAGALLIGGGLTILVLAKLGARRPHDGLTDTRVEGCLTFLLGAIPALLGCVFLLLSTM
jgi:hypothetical protein